MQRIKIIPLLGHRIFANKERMINILDYKL
jgi:hypothetical protein